MGRGADMVRIAIIGAGVAGLVTAACLYETAAAQKVPVDIQIFEKSPALLDNACSRYAGGMLAPWCERENAEEIVEIEGQGALGFWARWVDVVQKGTLVVAHPRDAAELDRFARRTCAHEWVTPRDYEPGLADRFARGLFYAAEGHLDPRSALKQLAHRLEQRGVQFSFGVSADPENLTKEYDWVVDCRGLAARDQVPGLRAVKGEMLVLHCPDARFTRPIRLLHPRIPLYIVPRGNGVFMLGATMIESDDRGRITARSMVELLNAAYALDPVFAEAEILEIGCDLRPAFADNLPKVMAEGRLIRVNGFYRHGFLLSPAMGQKVTQIVWPELCDQQQKTERMRA